MELEEKECAEVNETVSLTKECAWCSTVFIDTTNNHNKICCSKACVNKLWYKSNKELYNMKRHIKQVNDSDRQKEERIIKRLLQGKHCKRCGKPLNKNNKVGFCTEHRPNDWYLNNKERRSQYDKEYRIKNREKINVRIRERRKTDVNFDLACSLRERLKEAIKGSVKVGSAVKDLGCSIEELKKYLESKFQPGMTWNNWGLGKDKWQMDHIRPLCKFDLSDRSQFLEACHYTNLQPLWSGDHYKKSSLERHESL